MALRTLTSLVVLVLGCAPTKPFVRVEPINAYRAYGEYHPQTDDDAVVARAASSDPNAREIHLFQEALPPGIEYHNDVFSVASGYGHHLLGKYVYSPGKEIAKDELVAMVKKMCVAANANAAIIVFQLVPNEHQDRAQAIEAVLVDLHPAKS